MQEPFFYDEYWQLVVCMHCSYGIQPTVSHLTRHLRQHFSRRETAEQLPRHIISFQALALRSPHALHEFRITCDQPVRPVHHITQQNGMRCLSCHYITATQSRLRHPIISSCKRTSWQACTIQQFFPVKTETLFCVNPDFRISPSSSPDVGFSDGPARLLDDLTQPLSLLRPAFSPSRTPSASAFRSLSPSTSDVAASAVNINPTLVIRVAPTTHDNPPPFRRQASSPVFEPAIGLPIDDTNNLVLGDDDADNFNDTYSEDRDSINSASVTNSDSAYTDHDGDSDNSHANLELPRPQEARIHRERSEEYLPRPEDGKEEEEVEEVKEEKREGEKDESDENGEAEPDEDDEDNVAEDQLSERTAEEWRQLAHTRLSQARAYHCRCGTEAVLAEDEADMVIWAHRLFTLRYPVSQSLGRHAHTAPVTAPVPEPLDFPTILHPHLDHAGLPWQAQLSAGDDAPTLSIAKTEDFFLDSPAAAGLRILRRWDVDSFVARVTSLGAHRHGFRLSYLPPFLSRETQDQHVQFAGGCAVHLHKNLCLGSGVLAEGTFRTFIVFRHMSTTQASTHLNDKEQAFWVDRILLPVLRQTYGADVIQHHPHSFAAAKRKALAKQELHLSGARQPINLHSILPSDGLADFSTNLEQHIRDGVQRDPDLFGPFQDPFFIIAGHDIKLKFKRATLDEQRAAFLDFLDTCFHFTEEYFPAEDCWVDMGIEDTPEKDSCASPVILLRKPSCLKAWADLFAPDAHASHPGTTTSTYPWHLTRDAGSAEVLLGWGNPLREHGGVAYNKAYNVHKVLYDTPLKGHRLFALPQLEALAYGQDLLREWAEAGRLGSSVMKKYDRALLVKTFESAKARLRAALQDHERHNMGVRQEFRMLVREYRQHPAESDGDVQLAHEASPDGTHRPYWILSAHVVGIFLTADVNRWLLGIEFLISRADPAALPVGPLSVGREAQMLNGAMLRALLRTLCASLAGENPSRQLWLSRRRYDAKRQVVDKSKPSGVRWVRQGHQWLGLAYTESIAQKGVPGLPDDLVDWPSLSFRAEKLQRMVIRYGGLGAPPGQAGKVHDLIVRDGALASRLAEALQPLSAADSRPGWGDAEHLQQGLVTMTQLIVKQYIRDLFEKVLLGRAQNDQRHPDRRVQRVSTNVAQRLSSPGHCDFQGLDYASVCTLLAREVRVVVPKLPSADGQTRNKSQSHFPDYNGQNRRDWAGKLQGLFEWDDERGPPKKLRGWNNFPFRLLTRRFYALVVEHRGAAVAQRFRTHLGHVAARHLWLIPNYDHDHIAVLYKASSHHSPAKRALIQALPELDRTTWQIASVSPANGPAWRAVSSLNPHFASAAAASDDSDDSGERLRPNVVKVRQRLVRAAIENNQLSVWQPSRRHEEHTRTCLVCAARYGTSLDLTDADNISQDLPDELAQPCVDIVSDVSETETGTDWSDW